MKCPHCLVEINPNFSEAHIGIDSEGHWSSFTMNCPSPKCRKLIIDIATGEPHKNHAGGIFNPSLQKSLWRQTVRPFTSSRPPVPSEVDVMFAIDYKEACLIFNLSSKASAALSRRCLQNILRGKAGVKKGDLANEIQQVIDGKPHRTAPIGVASKQSAARFGRLVGHAMLLPIHL